MYLKCLMVFTLNHPIVEGHYFKQNENVTVLLNGCKYSKFTHNFCSQLCHNAQYLPYIQWSNWLVCLKAMIFIEVCASHRRKFSYQKFPVVKYILLVQDLTWQKENKKRLRCFNYFL